MKKNKDIKLINVSNVPDTSMLRSSNSNGWLAWWKEQKETEDDYKCVRCKKAKATDGGHVWVDTSMPLYIVPLCKDCNNPYDKETFQVPRAFMKKETDSDKKEWAKKNNVSL